MLNRVYAVVRFFCRWLFRLRVTGLSRLHFDGATILMPNHLSFLDAVVLAAHLPPEVTFVINTGIARKLGPIMSLFRHVTVDPLNPYSVRTMVKIVQQGTPLLMFPEGRLTTTGGLMKVYPGIGYIALRTGAQLFPIAINGLERSKLSRLGEKIKTVWFPEVQLDIGEPFRMEREAGVPMRVQKERAADRILRALQEQLAASRIRSGVNLFDELRAQSKRSGSQLEVCTDQALALSYRKLILAAYVFGRKLEPMLGAEQRVGLMLPNSVGHVITFFALLRLGKTPAMLNYSAGAQSLQDACETAEVRTLITSRLFVEKGKLEAVTEVLAKHVRILYLEDVREQIGSMERLGGLWDAWTGRKASAGAAEVVLFTSGSESKPKGVVLGHDNLFANIQQARSLYDFTAKDTLFNALPMFHSFGLTAGTLMPLLAGVKVILYPSPLHYKVIPELVYDRNATILCGTSTFLFAYGKLAHPYDFYKLRYVVAGGEKLKPEVMELWSSKFGLRIYEGYGTTEASPVLSINAPLAYRKGTVGRLLPGVRYQLQRVEGIEEGGSLLVDGPNLMKGYLIHGKGFVPRDGWYDCGDIVTIDEEGYIRIVSRLKRFAKIGGEMVSLNLVEEVAQQALGGTGYAAVSVSDGRKGERIILFTTEAQASVAHLKQYTATGGYSPLLLPSRVELMEKLPLLGSGKTDYVTLKKLAEQL
ncbi:AMP-binding protein [Paenibacillus cremeus]|uniref:AMP-binding protein n=1 Tax=Paenibacillus cremeus TaxID=2163881 RepID=A0A559K7M9_9BACL|nr:AMP-binding protein [Paenibacillus cremeus]TVY08136.1 AMP-binding protein [Paenibacillus cremeus]